MYTDYDLRCLNVVVDSEYMDMRAFTHLSNHVLKFSLKKISTKDFHFCSWTGLGHFKGEKMFKIYVGLIFISQKMPLKMWA